MARGSLHTTHKSFLQEKPVTTLHGRVVYHRKKRTMTAKDLWRIAKALPTPTKLGEALYFFRTLLVLWAKVALHDPIRDESFQERMGREIAAELEARGEDPADYGYTAPAAAELTEVDTSGALFHWPPWEQPFKP